MTIKELRKKLEKFDDNCYILVENWRGKSYDIDGIEFVHNVIIISIDD